MNKKQRATIRAKFEALMAARNAVQGGMNKPRAKLIKIHLSNIRCCDKGVAAELAYEAITPEGKIIIAHPKDMPWANFWGHIMYNSICDYVDAKVGTKNWCVAYRRTHGAEVKYGADVVVIHPATYEKYVREYDRQAKEAPHD